MRFDTLYHELEYSTEMIRSLMMGISQEDSQIKPNTEAWSILEVICHLYDEEREDFREHLDFILHRQDQEWHQIDPQAWVIERKYNQQDLAQMTARFFEERRISLEWLKKHQDMDLQTLHRSEYGDVPAGEMFASWIAHDNLHIRQLVELRRLAIERMTAPYAIGYAGDW
jgi:hypothetical protein